jgi:ribosome biogenesis GTPase
MSLTFLEKYGWDARWEEGYRSTGIDMPPGRVIGQYGRFLKCAAAGGEMTVEVSGRLSYQADRPADLPVTGDWVLLIMEENSTGLIYDVLPRKSWIARRKSANLHDEQILAANVDVLCVVSALDDTLNLNRIERYLLLAAEGRAGSMLLFNKLDLCENPIQVKGNVESRFPGTAVHFFSCNTGVGLLEMGGSFQEHSTHAFVGPSGVGKSTIINILLGEEKLRTGNVRKADHRGRHITSSRELFITRGGAIVLDTPGLRELALTGDVSMLDEVHGAIALASKNCRFSDCTHTVEQGCAVIEGVEEGRIPAEQYENYLKMRRELQHLERKTAQGGSYNPKKRWKNISKEIRRLRDTE